MKTTVSLVTLALVLVGRALIFHKMGEAEWKSLIPFYGRYVMYKNVWNKKAFVLNLVLEIVSGLLIGVAYATCLMHGSIALVTVCVTGATFTSLGYLVGQVMMLYRLSKSFGHGAGYTLGFVVLEPVFYMLLGCNSDAYVKA